MTDHLILTLRRRRRELGLSQRAVGELMGGKSRSWICDLEGGRHEPTLGMLYRWCEALGLQLDVREVAP